MSISPYFRDGIEYKIGTIGREPFPIGIQGT